MSRNNYSWYNTEFMNPGGPKKMASRFLKAGRLYAWDNSKKAFRKLNSSWNWSSDNKTYKPKSGDYYVRFNRTPIGTNGGSDLSGQHAMMVLSYLQDNNKNKRVSVLEMRGPVKIRNINPDPLKPSERFCVGKM